MHLVRAVATFNLIYLSMAMAISRKRGIAGTEGVYCDGSVLKQTTAYSALACAGECLADVQCVAYNHLPDSRCLLHGNFCNSADLMEDQGSLYSGAN